MVAASEFTGDDSVLSCLQSVINQKESWTKEVYLKATALDDFGPDIYDDFDKDSSVIDSSCETWINLRKLPPNNIANNNYRAKASKPATSTNQLM